eukprot:g3408.t1
MASSYAAAPLLGAKPPRLFCDETGTARFELRGPEPRPRGLKLSSKKTPSKYLQYRLIDLQHPTAPAPSGKLDKYGRAKKAGMFTRAKNAIMSLMTSEDSKEEKRKKLEEEELFAGTAYAISYPEAALENFPGDEDLTFQSFRPITQAIAINSGRAVRIRGLTLPGNKGRAGALLTAAPPPPIGTTGVDETTGFLPPPCTPAMPGKPGNLNSAPCKAAKMKLRKLSEDQAKIALARYSSPVAFPSRTGEVVANKPRRSPFATDNLQIEEQGVNPEYWRLLTERYCKAPAAVGATRNVGVFDPELGAVQPQYAAPLQGALPFRCYKATKLDPESQNRSRFMDVD